MVAQPSVGPPAAAVTGLQMAWKAVCRPSNVRMCFLRSCAFCELAGDTRYQLMKRSFGTQTGLCSYRPCVVMGPQGVQSVPLFFPAGCRSEELLAQITARCRCSVYTLSWCPGLYFAAMQGELYPRLLNLGAVSCAAGLSQESTAVSRYRKNCLRRVEVSPQFGDSAGGTASYRRAPSRGPRGSPDSWRSCFSTDILPSVFRHLSAKDYFCAVCVCRCEPRIHTMQSSSECVWGVGPLPSHTFIPVAHNLPQ